MNIRTKAIRFVIAFFVAVIVVLFTAKVMAADNTPDKIRKPTTPHMKVGPAESSSSANDSSVPEAVGGGNADQQNAMPKQATSGGSGGYAAPTWPSYYGQMDSIRADSERAQAELDNLKIHHQLDEARKGNFTSDGASPAGNNMSLPPLPLANQLNSTSDTGASRSATVDQVSMVDDHWTATVILPSGGHIPIRVGTNVPGVGRVTSIGLNEVLVVANNKTIPLAFASNAAEETTAYPQATFPQPAYPQVSSRPMAVAPPIGLH